MPLTPKQRRFVDEYLIDLNATQAAIRAGYSTATAEKKAPAWVVKGRVSEAIQAALDARSKRTEVTQDWVIQKLVQNVERAMQAVPVLDSDGSPTGEFRYEGGVANGALKLLGEHLGMYQKKVEHTGGTTQTHIYLPQKDSPDGGPVKPS